MASSNDSRWRSLLRALSHRNFRLFFIGQGVSLIGTWMQSLAMSWLVYRLTDSAFLLGLVNFAGQIPSFFLAPVAGVLSDRLNRHRTLVVTQTLAMLQAFLLAALTLTGEMRIGTIIALSGFLGCISAFDITTRQAFLLEMVPSKDDLANAIALNSSLVNGSRLLGPSLAGLVIAAVGEGVCFLLNGVSYLAVIAALLLMRVPARPRAAGPPRLLAGFLEGFRYAFGFPPLRAVLVLVAVVSLVGLPYTVLMPVFAREVLHGGPETLGYLMAASGVGALGSAVYLASRGSVLGLGIRITLGAGMFGLGLVGFAWSRNLWLSLALLFVIGFSMMLQMAGSNTVLQTLADEDKRGRVMSFYTMAFMGATPLGSLAAGALANRIDAPTTVLIGGGCCVVASALFARQLPQLRAIVRPIYVRMGILPEVAAGLQAATEMELRRD